MTCPKLDIDKETCDIDGGLCRVTKMECNKLKAYRHRMKKLSSQNYEP